MALTCLLDTSMWNRLDRAPALAAEVTALLHHGEVGYSDIERLEVLRSARHIDHYQRLAAIFVTLPKVALTEAAVSACRTGAGAARPTRSPPGREDPDLLIAAAAEEAGVRILHPDPAAAHPRLCGATERRRRRGWVMFTAALL